MAVMIAVRKRQVSAGDRRNLKSTHWPADDLGSWSSFVDLQSSAVGRWAIGHWSLVVAVPPRSLELRQGLRSRGSLSRLRARGRRVSNLITAVLLCDGIGDRQDTNAAIRLALSEPRGAEPLAELERSAASAVIDDQRSPPNDECRASDDECRDLETSTK